MKKQAANIPVAEVVVGSEVELVVAGALSEVAEWVFVAVESIVFVE